jgi:hypothetical protein
LSEHSYAAPHVVNGVRLHGGFDEHGEYVSPRMLQRGPAVREWTAALRARGGELFECSSEVLAGVRMPNTAQQRLLLREGLGQTFWNTLTITGIIEARGRVLAELPVPRFQDVVVEDVSEMALGHLHVGLLKAHGLDEGGQPALGIGGHDQMWFVLRDLAFGPTDHPPPEVPATITRPDTSEPMPEIARPQARMLAFLLNLLMIELRAEIGFSATEEQLRYPSLFCGRRAQAEQAVEMVGRIRQDEQVHLESLRLVLGEACALQFRTLEGGTVPGRDLIEPFWARILRWATVEQPLLVAERSKALLVARIRQSPRAEAVLAEFEALSSLAA